MAVLAFPDPPELEPRDYQQLLDAALARIPVHNPEWTNFNHSDPGVTLLELFAFLAESVAYRANQVPERNRRRFLELLGVPRAPGATARGIVTVANAHGPQERVTLAGGFELRAGAVPFAAERGLDVLPVEGAAFFKRRLLDPPRRLLDYHRQLYASFRGGAGGGAQLRDLALYETVPLDPASADGVALQETADGSLWIALLLRQGQDPPGDASLRAARRALAGATLSVGLVPLVADPARVLAPVGTAAGAGAQLSFQLPLAPRGGVLPPDPTQRLPQYRTLDARLLADVLTLPGVVELTLPSEPDALGLWSNLEPLESGAGEFPPSLDDTQLAERLVTWVRVRGAAGTQAAFQWAGVNATTVSQRVRVANEVPGSGTGEPDQQLALAHGDVIPSSVRLTVGDPPVEWQAIDDLTAAGPEVPVPDLRLPPGAAQPPPAPAQVFVLDPATGLVTFGDGARGARPPAGVPVRVTYDYGLGAAGNVGAGAISSAPALPTGMTVVNPVRTWGGAEAETVAAAEKQAARYLQHRDRLVTVEDFETIVWRTPGIELGRVDVLSAYDPARRGSVPGDAPGAVTLMVVPARDPLRPEAPEPDRPFLDAVCDFLEPRRLVTTELFVRGPVYKPVWISVGIDVLPGVAAAEASERVRRELLRFLAPVDPTLAPWWARPPRGVEEPYVHPERGWPLRKAIVALELVAVASRVEGVAFVRGLQLASGGDAPVDRVELSGLELPRVLGVAVGPGDPRELDDVRGLDPEPPSGPALVPVPLVPEVC